MEHEEAGLIPVDDEFPRDRKVAMLRIHRGLPERFPQARMLLQIHDELVFEAPQEQVAALDAWVREAMEQAMPLRVPLVVSSSWGATWDQ